jgi:uncharacterized protein with gpF-like domain
MRRFKQKQIDAMESMKLNTQLQLEMEEELNKLEEKFRQKELLLKEQHVAQVMKVSVDLYHRISYTHVYLVHFIIRIAR